ncbi:MAG: hypothetical protein OXN89_07825 [Bryobacterales bacterium]|nr:hypothetical protein [Bryobacterales bacterium]
MAEGLLSRAGSVLHMLNPADVQARADEPVTLGLLASDELFGDAVVEFLFPESAGQVPDSVIWITGTQDFRRATVGFSEAGIPHPPHFYVFDPADPTASAARILNDGANEDRWLALAARFPGLRRGVSERVIWKIAKENTFFAATTSLPNVVPSLLSLPWVVGEFASDMAFLTMNQVRMAFLLAAAHGRTVGYDRQTLPIGTVLGAGFGWRSIARELVAKVPGGAGVLPKAVVAFAGTYAVGRALEHWFRSGGALGRAAEAELFEDGARRGRATVERIVKRVLSGGRRSEA